MSGANRNDYKLLEATIASTPVERPDPSKLIQNMLLDKGYDYMDVYNFIEEEGYEGHVAQRKNSPLPPRKRKPGRKKARRWVVERTHSWMNRFRRILTRWEKKIANYIGLLHFVCGIIAFRAIGVLG